MDTICQSDIFTKEHKIKINRVRKHKAVHSIADLTLCDGVSIDPSVWTREPSHSSRVFSEERPTRADFKLFHSAVRNVCRGEHSLSSPLGAFINKPHRRDTWFTIMRRRTHYTARMITTPTRYTPKTHRGATPVMDVNTVDRTPLTVSAPNVFEPAS